MNVTEKSTTAVEKTASSYFFVFNILSGVGCDLCSKLIDLFLIMICVAQLGFGVFCWLTINQMTAVGYISAGIFSGTTLKTLKEMRLRASLQSSVNVLQDENEELKENNEELKDNIDDLESVSKKLANDLKMLKETIGLFGNNSNEIIENLREVYNGLKRENEIQANLNRNSIYLHILQIIQYYQENNNEKAQKAQKGQEITNQRYILKQGEYEKAKRTLMNAFPHLKYEELEKKIKERNRITAKNIFESISAI
jgi:hypothetical protein